MDKHMDRQTDATKSITDMLAIDKKTVYWYPGTDADNER